jgi:hypothetical protein
LGGFKKFRPQSGQDPSEKRRVLWQQIGIGRSGTGARLKKDVASAFARLKERIERIPQARFFA